MRLNILFITLATISMVSAQGGCGGGGGGNQQAGQAGQTVQPVQSGQTIQTGQYPPPQVNGQTNPQNGGQGYISGNNPQNQPNQNKQGGGGGPNAVVGAVGGAAGAVAGGVNSVTGSVNSAATNFGLFVDSLPKCFKKCTQESSTTVGCSGLTDINCICSNPQFISSVVNCASLDKECSQNQFSIQQGQSAFTSFCQNNTQSGGATSINSTFSSSSGRSRWPITNDAAASSQNVVTVGMIILSAIFTCATVFL